MSGGSDVFSVLSFYSLTGSSLPLFVHLPCFQNNLCSSLKQSHASFSLFGSLLQVHFLKVLPPLVFFSFFFSFSFPISTACFPLFSKKFLLLCLPILIFSLYLSVFIASGSDSDDALSCHGIGRGGVRQLCTVDPCHCMTLFSSSFGVVIVHASVGGVSKGTSRGNEREGALQGRETSSSPPSAYAGEEEAHCHLKRYCFVLSSFFFFFLFFVFFVFSPYLCGDSKIGYNK
ncbi:hypothetical protein NC651_007255 [Populus alba x Populus x berolinensis]|nr:hypothetical protein NC651_007255 [Populus alba x Populus x berolinensis]